MELWKIGVVAILALYFGCSQVNFVTGLECYICTNQTDNREKCLSTISACSPGEDVCATEIRWGSQPYFSEGALKQYYVSKSCMTKQRCQQKRQRYMPYCTHIWYEDWTCYECCQGDRCNYYVISSSNKLQTTMATLMAFAVVISVTKKLLMQL